MEAESPLACDLTALDAELKKRHRLIAQQLRAAAQQIQELADGYALRFPSESALCLAVAEFITLERLCCPFLNFALELQGEGGPLWLRMTGRQGVKEFLETELGIRGQTHAE